MYLKHSLVYLLSKLAPAFSSFIVLAAYTRWLSTEEYGILSTTLIVASSVNLFMFGWLYTGIMRFWDNRQIDNETITYLISASLAIISLLIGLFAILFAVFTGQVAVALAFWVLFVSAALFEAWQRINSITREVRRYLWVEIMRTVLTTAIGLCLVWLGYAWQGAVTAVVLGMVLVVFFSGALRYLHLSRRVMAGGVLKKLLVYGLPLSISLALLEVINTADRVMIGSLLGYASAGEYAVAYNLPFQILMMITSSLNLAAYPFIIRALEQEGVQVAGKQLQQYFIILMTVSVPAVFGLLAIAEQLIPLLVGEDFVPSALELLPWVCLAVFANCSYIFYVSLSFQLAQHTTGALKIAALAALLNVLLNAVLIPLYGLWGAAVASVTAYLFCLVTGFYLGRRYFTLELPLFELAKITLAAVIMYVLLQSLPVLPLVMWPSPTLLLVKIVLGALIYALLIWLFNVGEIRQHLSEQINIRRLRV